MDSRELIDAQFDRAVEIVQNLPKNGPVQTDYEEKLTMYSLYKQATVGNVTSPRPGIWDMLGRAKWDAWEKHKDIDPYGAKWLYVDALMKVLKKYPDKTLAQSFVRELESYAGDPNNMLISRSLSRNSDSTGSSASETDPVNYPTQHYQPNLSPRFYQSPIDPVPEHGETTSDSSSEVGEPLNEPPVIIQPTPSSYYGARPRAMSSASAQNRYRAPLVGTSAMTSPPPISPLGGPTPQQQPLPRYEFQSAYNEGNTGVPTPTMIYPSHLAHSSRSDGGAPPVPMHMNHLGYRVSGSTPSQTNRRIITPQPPRPSSRPTIEGAIENVQTHLAAITERIESLEFSTVALRSSALLPLKGNRSPDTSNNKDGGLFPMMWDVEDMGLWSLVLRPLSRFAGFLRRVIEFLSTGDNNSPALVVVRRLFLDISFILCALTILRMGWKKSGVRRAEIVEALHVLGRAVAGKKRPRRLVTRGVSTGLSH